MSKMTNRLGSKELINIAKQQHETQQLSKLLTVSITLPSGGKPYPNDHVLSDGHVELRYPTAYHEDILTNSSYIEQGIALDKLLESLCVTEIDINDLILADKEKILISARVLAYGPEYNVSVTDPKTKKVLQRTIDLSKLEISEIQLDADENGEFSYDNEDLSLKFIFPNGHVLAKIKEESTVTDLLKNIIKEVNGDRKQSTINEFIKYKLLAKDARNFRKFVEEQLPVMHKQAEFEGEDGSTFNAGFQIRPDFFWS